MPSLAKPRGVCVVIGGIALVLAGCGLRVNAADLFVLQRTGQGRTLTLLVSDGGTIRCNGGPAKPLPDPLLLQARDLATNLDKDAKARLSLPGRPASVYTYRFQLQDGTVSFADTSAGAHPELAPAELFAAQTAHAVCGAP
jgi:hypothetical protein